MKKLKVLFYGLTHEHACGKLETLRQMDGIYEIVGVVDDRAAATRPYFIDRQANIDGLRVFTAEESLSLGGIDAAFIETTNADLMKTARIFAEKGVPMHCDKPCGESMEPYRSIVETCRRKNIPFQVGYMYRGNPALKFARNAVRSGWLGDVGFVEADMNHDYQLDGYSEYISSFKGGIMYNLGCHLVDMVLPLVRGRLESVVPMIGDAPGDPAGSRTSGTSLLSFEGGAKALIRTSAHMPGGIEGRRLRVDGTNGTLELCPIERFDGKNLLLEMTLKSPAGGYGAGRNVLDFGVLVDRYRDQLEDLARIVRGEKANDQDYDWDLQVHEVTLRACGAI
jgi:predicted dehydrogenase